MIKICYIGRARQVGGAELGLADIVKNIDKKRFSPLIILPHKNSQNFRMIQKNLPDVPLIHVSFEENILEYFANIEQFPLLDPIGLLHLRSAIKKIKPDIIHSNDFRAGKYGSEVAKSLKIPNVVTIRSIYYKRKFNFQHFVESRLVKNATRIVFNSERGRDLFKQRIKANNIITILNGINLNKFSDTVESNLIYDKYDISQKRKIILIPARICKEKGQHVVVKVIPEILKITENLHFIFIGNSQPGQEEYLQSLKNFAIQNNVENHITWIDFSSDMAQFYKSSFAVLLPSFLEGTPRVLLEALSVGVPVIGSSIDGINEIIEPGQNGYKFDLNNPHTLIQAFSTLNSLTENQYAQMKIACRKFAEDKYTIQRMIAEYEQLYERVLQNPYEN